LRQAEPSQAHLHTNPPTTLLLKTKKSPKSSSNGANDEIYLSKTDPRNPSQNKKKPLRPLKQTLTISMRTTIQKKRKALRKHAVKPSHSWKTEKIHRLVVPVGNGLRSWLI
jgi:hypothetical protein